MSRRPGKEQSLDTDLNNIQLLLGSSRADLALQLCQSLLNSRKKDPNFWFLLAATFFQLSQFANCKSAVTNALELNDKHVSALVLMGRALLRTQNSSEATLYFEQALRLAPEQSEIWVHLGKAYCDLWRLAEAEASFLRATELMPDNADAYYRLADVREQMHHADDARDAAEAALACESGHHMARLLLARLERRSGNLEEAQDKLLSLLKEEPEHGVRCVAEIELAFVRDQQNRWHEAYELFSAGQRRFAHHYGAGYQLETYRNIIARNRTWFTPEHVADWSSGVVDSNHTPVFLVGFPRSGTTLTEQILASHPAVSVSDEQPALDNVIQKVTTLANGMPAYPRCLSLLDEKQLKSLRRTYWEYFGGTHKSNELLVDKLPLNLVHLGLVYRLFPQARIIVALRDPRDVCLSNFMQIFQLNQAMIHFCTLEDTVLLYCDVMALWLQYRELLPLNHKESRYEDLVADLPAHARDLTDFLGLEWNDSVLKFYSDKHRRVVSTPSNLAVVQPIYSSSVGRWQNYAKQFESLQPLLQPYIESFGYQ